MSMKLGNKQTNKYKGIKRVGVTSDSFIHSCADSGHITHQFCAADIVNTPVFRRGRKIFIWVPMFRLKKFMTKKIFFFLFQINIF